MIAQWILRARIRYSTRKGEASNNIQRAFTFWRPSSLRETGTDHTNGGREAGFWTGTRLECDIWLAGVVRPDRTLPEWRHHGLKKERERDGR